MEPERRSQEQAQANLAEAVSDYAAIRRRVDWILGQRRGSRRVLSGELSRISARIDRLRTEMSGAPMAASDFTVSPDPYSYDDMPASQTTPAACRSSQSLTISPTSCPRYKPRRQSTRDFRSLRTHGVRPAG